MRERSAVSTLKSQSLNETRVEDWSNIRLATITQIELLQRTLREVESKLSPGSASLSAQGRGKVNNLIEQQLEKLFQLGKLYKSSSSTPEQILLVTGDIKNIDDALQTEISRIAAVLIPTNEIETWGERELTKLRIAFLEKKK